MTTESFDAELRTAAMRWLASRGDRLLASAELATFEFRGQRIALMGQAGIRKPAVLEGALSIRTTFTPPGRTPPYADEAGSDGLLRYKYRGEDPNHSDNRSLRICLEQQLPLIWFLGIEKSRYIAQYPVYVMQEEKEQLQFVVAVDPVQRFLPHGEEATEDSREYAERLTRRRIHQPVFRARVLQAYGLQCAICHLRHTDLLDAAHILPDGHPMGRAVVPNGLALCKIHHAAFDRNILGVRPDLVVEIRPDILKEIDGPMLKHGLQEMNGVHLSAPRGRTARPAKDNLEERYEEFRAAG